MATVTLDLTINGTTRSIVIDAATMKMKTVRAFIEAQREADPMKTFEAHGEAVGLRPDEVDELTVQQFRDIAAAVMAAIKEALNPN